MQICGRDERMLAAQVEQKNGRQKWRDASLTNKAPYKTARRLPAHLGKTGYAERLIGSIRRECIDHVVVFSERHLRHLLLCYMKYYNATRTDLSLEKDG